MDRSYDSVALKLKRLTKKNNTYNQKHLKEKYEINEAFLLEIQPETVLDLYTGERDYYNDYLLEVTNNDINKEIPADYHEDAYRLILRLYLEGKKYDLIDLDPYGSAYDLLDTAVRMAEKGLIITLGEMGHKRWGRIDYVGPRYGISSIEEFTLDKLIQAIIQIGARHKKKLTVAHRKEWPNIARVWFRIESQKGYKGLKS